MKLSVFLSRAVFAILFFGLCPTPPASAQGAGYWHTRGAQIFDANNQPVRIAGINWYGFETTDAVVHGLTTQDYKTILQTVKNEGYNTIRVPFSNQMVETPGTNLTIGYRANFGAINTDLQGLNSLQVLDKIVAYAGTIGLKIILDDHRSEAGNSAEANGLWYTGSYPEASWIADWQALATRYLNNATVIGIDLRNEPHNAYSGGSCWDCGGANDWHLAAARGGNAVLAINPNLLIFVEGTDAYNNDYYWWGGNLEGVANSPVTLNVANQLVYSAHDYGPNEYAQSWFSGDSAGSLAAVWTAHWAYISRNGTAPVWLGEFGTENSDVDVTGTAAGSQGLWFQSVVNFMKANPALNWTYWALNGEDAYGLLDSNYDATPADALKQSTLATIQFPLNFGVTTATPPAAASGLSAVASSSSQISLAWTASSTAGVSYTVYFGTNAGSIGTEIASGVTATSYSAAGLNASTTYYFTVVAVSASGVSPVSNAASATTSVPTIPAAPLGLSANAVSSSQINLAWLVSAGSGVTYSVYSEMGAGGAAVQNASGLTGTVFEAANLSAGTSYTFWVVASTAGGSSAPSTLASATTQAQASALPGAATGLSASTASASQINLAWQPSSSSGVTYNVYAGSAPGATNTLLASGLPGTYYSASNLLDSTTYYFIVKAVSSSGVSGASNQASAQTQTLPATAPAGLSAYAVSSSEIDLAWPAVVNSGASYAVYFGTSSGAENTLLATGLAGTTYQAVNLGASTAYYFVVRSISKSGTSSPSSEAGATTQALSVPVVPVVPVAPPAAQGVPAPPAGLVAVAVSSSQINLSWSASAGSGMTYNIYSGTTLAAGGVSTTSYTASNLQAGTSYTYTVTATSSAGTSPASAPASAATQAAATGGCHVAYTVQNDWGAGFTGALAITNNGSAAMTSWTVTWTFAGNQQIYQSWDGNYTQSGQAVSIVSAAWNGTIAPGGTASGIGWNANYSGANVNPATFSVNGVVCK